MGGSRAQEFERRASFHIQEEERIALRRLRMPAHQFELQEANRKRVEGAVVDSWRHKTERGTDADAGWNASPRWLMELRAVFHESEGLDPTLEHLKAQDKALGKKLLEKG